MPSTQPIDLQRLHYDPVYYEELKANILLRIFLREEMRKLIYAELDAKVLYGRGSDVLPTGVLGTEQYR